LWFFGDLEFCNLSVEELGTRTSVRPKARKKQKGKVKTHPCKKTQGWGTLRVFLVLVGAELGNLSRDSIPAI
jgi:hypothetical protein